MISILPRLIDDGLGSSSYAEIENAKFFAIIGGLNVPWSPRTFLKWTLSIAKNNFLLHLTDMQNVFENPTALSCVREGSKHLRFWCLGEARGGAESKRTILICSKVW